MMSLKSLLPRLVFLAILDVIAIQLTVTLGSRINIFLGAIIAVMTIIINIVFLKENLFPWRWITPALAGMALLVIYPIGYAVSVAFTNYGDGHLLDKQQVIDQKRAETFASPNAPTYKTYIYRSDEKQDFRFWFIAPDGKTYMGAPGDAPLKEIAADDASVGERDDKGIPKTLDGFNRLPPGGALRFNQTLQAVTIGTAPNQISITKLALGEVHEAKPLLPLWTYDPAADTLTNNENNKIYHSVRGTFVTGEGETREELSPGFRESVGFDNIVRVVTDENVRDPFWRVFVWTVAFAAGSVFTTFAVGLGFAMIMNAPDLPFRALFRSILIIPYAIPGWLTVTTWRGLLNPVFGPVNLLIAGIIGISPQWFSDPTLTKIGILFVNLYLGFPYMMLICLGALQSIPGDMYEAATIDGANGREQFRFITLPLLLVAVGPLLVASFAYNFNNFTIIELFNNGGPPISAATVAGHSDILLSYTYRLAFAGGRGTDYGFASAIGLFIFLIVGTITFVNFRFTRRLEEVNN